MWLRTGNERKMATWDRPRGGYIALVMSFLMLIAGAEIWLR